MFFFFFFYFHITNYFLRHDACFPTSNTCFIDDLDGIPHHDNEEMRGGMTKTPKRCHATSLGHLVCPFSFSFIFILLTIFRTWRLFSDIHHLFHWRRHIPSQRQGNERCNDENTLEMCSSWPGYHKTVVLPSGEVIKTRRRSCNLKSSAGFDTTKLFIGEEGTLGTAQR